MGIALPQLAPASTDRVSGAQVISGSLKFDGRSGGNHAHGHLKRTSSGASGAGTFTISWWTKRGSMRDDWQYMIAGDNGSLWGVGFPGSSGQRDSLTLFNGTHQYTSARFRDNSGWYHIVLNVNASTGPKLWVNGEAQSNSNTNASWNLNNTMYIGKWVDSGTAHNYDGYLAQYTCIDGLELGPSYFAYTDPLTGAWRPKKFVAEGTTVNDGTEWTTKMSNTSLIYVGSASNMFNGNALPWNTSNYASFNQGILTLLTGVNIEVKDRIRIFGNWGYGDYIVINGVNYLNDGDGTNKWITPTGLTYPFTLSSLAVDTTPLGYQNSISAVEIDGVIMKDNTTQNLAFGSAGFYLPLDGNTPIGKDQSGNGNDWTPVGFGGSNDITKATGALPILNTGNGGTVARPGVLGSEVSRNYTILGTSGGGLYRFEGISETNPPLSFVRGATYIFDYSATSGAHPLAFSTTDPDSSTTSYTDGVNTATSNVTKITVPHNAPDTLYYYCTSHSNMNNAITVTTDETKADPYAWKCILAMPMVSEHDVSGDMNCNTTNDDITNNSVTFNDDQTVFYNQSADPDGSQYFSGVDLSSWATDSPWTVEFWWYRTGANTNNHGHFVGGTIGGTNQYGPTYRDGSHNDWQFNFKGQSIVITPSPALQTDKWEHHAFTSDGNNITYFRDGVFQTTAGASSMSGSWGSSNEIFRGGAGWSSQYVQGHVCDMRIYAGVEKYTTAGFIPASTNPDIVPESPSGVATKSKLKKITDGAVSISRTSNDYLLALASTNFRLDGQYCIEFFLNLTDYSNDSVYVRTFVLDGPTGDGGSTNIHLNVNPSNGQLLLWSGSSQQISPNAYTYVGGGWHHVCLTRDSSNRTRLFIDGVLGNWSDISTDYNLNTNQNRPQLGALGSTGGTTGHYSNFRIIKGSIPTEYQTSTSTNGTKVFDPPTEALTTTSQGATASDVKLLGCQSNTEPGGAAVAPSISGANNGTNWSHYVTGDIDSSFPAWRAFRDDTTSVGCRTQTANGATIVWQPPSPIAFSSSFKIWAARDGSHAGTVFTVTHAGGDTNFTSSVVTTTTQTAVDLAQIGGVTSPITKITIVSGGPNPRFSGIEVDSVMLVDPLSPRGGPSATNFNPFNSDINTVRGQETGYATLHPLATTVSLRDGNLRQAQTSGTWNVAISSIPMSTGKWYCEATLIDGNTFQIGIIKLDDGPNWGANFPLVDYEYGWGMVVDGVAKLRSDYIAQVNGATDIEYNSTAPVAGDTIGMAYDADTQALTFYVNGRSYGDTTSYWNYPPTPGEYVFGNSVVANTDALWNFGQKPFKFPPPDGYQPLTSSTVRPDTVVSRPEQYVSATLYTGDNNSSQDINVGFAPDLVWQKIRSQAGDHALTDTVRGISGGYLQSEDQDAQKGNANDGISAFLPNGFRAYNSFNNNGLNWVSWCWKAGGSSNTFNIDDVGYTNASDVNMNSGAFNSSTFLKGQVWSGLMSVASGSFDQAATRAFDGFLRTDPNRLRTSDNQATVTMNLSSVPVTVSSQIKVHAEPGYNSTCTVTVGGVTHTSSGQAVHTFNVSGSLTQMTLQSNQSGGRTYMEGMEIDGKLLVDDNITINAPSVDNTGCSVGTKQGFSIVAYNATGSNLRASHGLSERPGFIILKSKNVSGDWLVWHQGLSSVTHFMKLNETQSENQADNVFLSVDEYTFGTGDDAGINSNTQQKIAYIWHDVPGLQKFGRYSGNSSSSGPFIECGFRPAMVLLKKANNTDANSGWHWYDNERNTYNPANNFLLAGHNYHENRAANNTATITSYTVDFLSNGFRLSHSSNNLNLSGSDYIYCAWAEAPSFNLYGAQSSAR